MHGVVPVAGLFADSSVVTTVGVVLVVLGAVIGLLSFLIGDRQLRGVGIVMVAAALGLVALFGQ